MTIERRQFIRNLLAGVGLISLFPYKVLAASQCSLEHPFIPPKVNLKGECHNCGMKRPMWARTWHKYQIDGDTLSVCSMHCLAEASINSAIEPKHVQVALYLDPEKSIPTESAIYVVGSQARGTMTMNSKLAFASKKEAESFAKECGGSVVNFDDAYLAATKSIVEENKMITNNRVKKGKIVEPVDNVDKCPVCGMYAARYPRNKCQIQSVDGEILQFCATQCLFEFIKNPSKYNKPNLKAKFTWVVDYSDGNWIYGRNAYYVIGSSEMGPMGKEAFPFVNAKNAEAFKKTHSGEIVRFTGVTIDKIMM